MRRRVVNFHFDGLFFFSLVIWGIVGDSRAAEGPITNQFPRGKLSSGTPVLRTAEEIHRLTRREAAGGQRVLIRGVITCAFPGFEAAVVQDTTRGIYTDNLNPSLGGTPAVGEFVEVEGVTDPGQFAPGIHSVRITRLGTRELPPPIHPYWDQLINGSLDTQFVEIEGILTTVQEPRVTLLTHGGKINALVFDTNGGTNTAPLKPHEGALVRLGGCLFASW